MAYLIWTWLVAHGCSAACAAALLGNAQTEVGPELNPCTYGRYIGLFQWGGERRSQLLRRYGQHWCKLEHQLEFMTFEMRQRGVWERLKNTRSVATAAAIVAEFEGGSGFSQRYALSVAYHQQLKRITIPPAIEWRWVSK